MDLTDINPTIISTDTEDEDHADGACHKLKRKLSFKNPMVRWLPRALFFVVVFCWFFLSVCLSFSLLAVWLICFLFVCLFFEGKFHRINTRVVF